MWPDMRFLVLLFLVVLVNAKDYYKILDISKDADDKTIKLAYRRLSKQYHPDKNPGEDAHEKFIEIAEAYEVLSDSNKRRNYDTYGDANGQQGGHHVDFGDIFNQFFGGGQPSHHGHPGNQRHVRKGPVKQVSMAIPLQYFYSGEEVGFNLNINTLCAKCDGSGSKDKERHTCNNCKGQGILTMQRQFGPGMFQTFQVQCEECHGQGTTIKHKCDECHGSGIVNKVRHYDIYVDAGTERNHQYVLESEGDEGPDIVPGDIVINIQEDFVKSWGYRRIGTNLYRTEVLTLTESLKGGWERSIPFFDKIETEIFISRKEGQMVVNGEIEVIKGRGMPHEHDFGDLYIDYKVLIGDKNKNFEKDEL